MRFKTKLTVYISFMVIILLAVISGAAYMLLHEPDGDEPAPSGSAGEEVTITLFDTIDDKKITDAIVEAYTAQNPSVNVKIEYLVNDDYDDQVREMMYAGTQEFDCFYIRQPSQSNQYAVDGLLLDITDYSTQNLDVANYGPTVDIVSVNDHLYALPRVKSAWLLFYNKDIFDEMGIAYPGQLTWDEYADLAKRLTLTREDGTVRWGGYVPPWTMNLGATSAGEYLTDDELPITKLYIEFLNRIYNVDKSHMGVADMLDIYVDPNPLFQTGEVAMMVNGDWTVYLLNGIEQETGVMCDWDIAPLPVFDFVEPGSTVGGCSYLAITRNTEHPDICMDFMAFYCGEQGATIIAENAQCPAYFTEEAAQIYLEQSKRPGAKYFFESYVANEEGSYPLYRDINEAFKEEMGYYLTGEKGIVKAFSDYYARRVEILT